MAKQTFEFQTQTRRMLDLMVHSVYSNKDIFLRELISNASDAIDKLRFEALTNKELASFTKNPQIRIDRDEEKRIISVSDNGIGMSHDEIIEFIGTIAKSGSKELLEIIKKAEEDKISPELIGQFGVGFYSSFMVADEVSLITRKAGEDKAWKWISTGEGSYTIEPASRMLPGTTVTLKLKEPEEEEKDYTQEYIIRSIVKKYSDFVEYPIVMKVERQEQPTDDEGKPIQDAEPITKTEDEILNSQKAIWTRPQDEVTEEELNEFYKHIAHDWTDPQTHIYYRGEGTALFRALLFIPSTKPYGLMFPDSDHGLSLYIRNVFIMSDYKELIPQWLRFIRGVVDSEDLTLNISRESLQQNRVVKIINKAITRKIIREFEKMLDDDREEYIKIWNNFGQVIKEGLFRDMRNQQDILKITLLESTKGDELTTLKEYIERMPDDQEKIYYISGKKRSIVENSPHLEAFRDKGYEVLLLTEPVDELWITYVNEFDGKELESIGKGEVDLHKADEESQEDYKSLTEFLKGKLEDDVKDVRLSGRLKSSPACLVGEKNDMTPQMEQMLRASGQEVPKVKRILELNPDHSVIKRMNEVFAENPESKELADYANILYNQALLAEGGQLDDPGKFAQKLAELMAKAL
ncbi:MAG: molecular chaperone HtpG [Candidatus Zixiibacteriota bacterium]